MTKRCGKPSNKWLSSEAVLARRARRSLERRYRRTRAEKDRLAYRVACRNTNRHISELRRAHYAEKLAETEGDARSRWKVIKKLLHSDERVTTRDVDQTRCDMFSLFFSDKLAKIASKIRDVIAFGSLTAPVHLVHAKPEALSSFAWVSDDEVC